MKAYVLAAALAALGGAVVAGEVVVPQDDTPFTVEKSDVVRIPAKGIAGTRVTAKVTGPAKETVNAVSTRAKGRPVIGPGDHEVEVRPTGKGTVIVQLTTTPPNGPATTEKYTFEVK